MTLGRMAGERLSLLSLSGLSLILFLFQKVPWGREKKECAVVLPKEEKVVRELHDIRASLCGHHLNYRRRHPHCAMEGVLWIEGA